MLTIKSMAGSKLLQRDDFYDNQGSMKYQLYQLKLEQLVSYFQEGAINLSPAFQRGKVWVPSHRKNLLRNILHGKPVPAIFLFKKPMGDRNSYVILDGKQRLESILLYVADARDQFKIPNWKDYFSRKEERDEAGFAAKCNGEFKSITQLSSDEIRKFRDYLLSIIEIDFDEEASLDEIIQLFVDINQYGVKVKRFAIVKALYLKDPLLRNVFDLVAVRWEVNRQDPLLKIKKSVFCKVLGAMDSIRRVASVANRIDVMWERMFEFALFVRNDSHGKPANILRDFIGRDKGDPKTPRLSGRERQILNQAFTFIFDGYKASKFNGVKLSETRWAKDQTHFYTMASSLIRKCKNDGSGAILDKSIYHKLIGFDALMTSIEASQKSGTKQIREGKEIKVEKYMKLSEKQTTDVAKRTQREQLFWEILDLL